VLGRPHWAGLAGPSAGPHWRGRRAALRRTAPLGLAPCCAASGSARAGPPRLVPRSPFGHRAGVRHVTTGCAVANRTAQLGDRERQASAPGVRRPRRAGWAASGSGPCWATPGGCLAAPLVTAQAFVT